MNQAVAVAKQGFAPPPAALPLRANFAWTAVGNAVYSASQWAMVAALAKLTDVETVGRYALGLAVTAPILMLAQLNLRTVLATDVKGEHRFSDYRNLRLLAVVLAVAVTAALALMRGGSAEARWTILLVGLAQSAEALSDIYHGLLQKHERMERVAVSLALRGLLSLAALIAGVVLTGALRTGLLAMLATRLAVLVLYDAGRGTRDLRQGERPAEGWRAQGQLLHLTAPLGVTLMLGALMSNMPRYFIAGKAGEAALGVFSAAAVLVSAGNMLVNALGQAATPRMARLFAGGEAGAFRRLAWRLTGMGLALGVAGVAVSSVAGQAVLRVVYREEYAAHAGLLVALMGAGAIGYAASLMGYAITAARRFHEQVPLLALSAGATAICSWIWIPAWGLTGAAAATGAGAATQLAGEVAVLAHALRRRPVRRREGAR